MTRDVLMAVSCAIAAGLISAWSSRRLCDPSSAFYILDHPNERSLHTRPTPRTGGLAIALAVLLAGSMWVLYTGEAWAKSAGLGICAAFVAAISFVDDHRHIEPHYRLVAHFAAAFALLLTGFSVVDSWLPGAMSVLPPGLGPAMTLLYVVWMLELYNFMDGLDGFAGGMTVVGFGSLAILGAMGGADVVAGLSLVVSASAFGFLLFNFPPAAIFMGDVGSATLGFLAAALSVWGAQSGAFPFWAAGLVFSPFIVDASVTLGRRALRREKVWQPHRTHYYQRLVRVGWNHRSVVLSEYALMTAASISAIWAVRQPAEIQWSVLLGWALIYGFLIAFINIHEMSVRGRPVATARVRNVPE